MVGALPIGRGYSAPSECGTNRVLIMFFADEAWLRAPSNGLTQRGIR